MNLNDLLYEVAEERARQNEKHPASPKYLTFRNTNMEGLLEMVQTINDETEAKGEHTYEGIIMEEIYEVFTAKTREERHIEIVQAIALLVRLDEDEAI